MKPRLADEVAIVTGGTRGIGQAIAVRFAREGASVVFTGRNVEAGAKVESSIREGGGDATFVPMDITSEPDVRETVGRAVDAYGRLTILVNNAAPTELTVGPNRIDGTIATLSTEAWNRVLTANLTSVFWGCKYAIPAIGEAGGGAILNVSSLSAVLGLAGTAAYSAAKAGLHALTRSVAVEAAGAGVRANCLVPGGVQQETGSLRGNPALAEALREMHLMRLGQPNDIASAALFLVSAEAAFITGAIIPIDGGATAKMPIPALRPPTAGS